MYFAILVLSASVGITVARPENPLLTTSQPPFVDGPVYKREPNQLFISSPVHMPMQSQQQVNSPVYVPQDTRLIDTTTEKITAENYGNQQVQNQQVSNIRNATEQPENNALDPRSGRSQDTQGWLLTGNIVSNLMFISSRLIAYSGQIGTYLIYLTLLTLLGGIFTTGICMFTPLCDIASSAFGIKNEVKQQVAEIARTYMTTENLDLATLLVTKAIDKYSAMQRLKQMQTQLKDGNKQ